MSKMTLEAFKALRGEYDLREIAVPYSRVGDLVTVSDEALAAMRAAPARTSIPVTGQDLLPFMTDAEIDAANAEGIKFLARRASDKFMAAKRRYFGLPERKAA